MNCEGIWYIFIRIAFYGQILYCIVHFNSALKIQSAIFFSFLFHSMLQAFITFAPAGEKLDKQIPWQLLIVPHLGFPGDRKSSVISRIIYLFHLKDNTHKLELKYYWKKNCHNFKTFYCMFFFLGFTQKSEKSM